MGVKPSAEGREGLGECTCQTLLGSVGYPCPFPVLGHMVEGHLKLSGSLRKKGLSLFLPRQSTAPAAAGLRGPGRAHMHEKLLSL